MVPICPILLGMRDAGMLLGMKTTLWATLTANGNYQRNDPQHPPRPEALADFAAHVRANGNFIVGRTTFEGFSAQQAASGGSARPADSGGVGNATIVVVGSKGPPGVATARNPKEALALLRDRGFSTAFVAGGAKLHNAFLAEDLVDELVFNIAPGLEDEGLKLVLPKGQFRTVTLIESKSLGGGVVQLRYDVRG
ncbi:MAG: dihydrofolate reductase family protein [Polyangiaceae bacterium]